MLHSDNTQGFSDLQSELCVQGHTLWPMHEPYMQTSDMVHETLSLHGVLSGCCTSFGQNGSTPLHVSGASQKLTAARQMVPLLRRRHVLVQHGPNSPDTRSRSHCSSPLGSMTPLPQTETVPLICGRVRPVTVEPSTSSTPPRPAYTRTVYCVLGISCVTL